MSGLLRDLVPPVLRGLLPSYFDRPQLDEVKATCSDCAMCAKGEIALDDDTPYFRPDSKCCTFHPMLPNFYVGGLLADPDPYGEEGRRRVREKLRLRFGVSPYWLAPPRKFRVFMDASRMTAFGRTEKLRCPFYDEGRCTIWRHRESICSTYYCKHVTGASGRMFWLTLKDWFVCAERNLSKWAVNEINPTLKDDGTPKDFITLDDLEDRSPGDAEHRAMWGDWMGREEEFYRECHARVKRLTPDEFLRIVMDDQATKALLHMLERHDQVTAPRLEPNLVLAKNLWRKPARGGGERVISYSTFDPQVVSEDVMVLLKQMRPEETVDEFIRRMRNEHNVDVPRALLLRMQLFEILVTPQANEDKKVAPKKAEPKAEPKNEPSPATK